MNTSGKPWRFVIRLITAAAVAVLGTAIGTPAFAAESGPNLDDPTAVISAIAPDILASTSKEDHVSVGSGEMERDRRSGVSVLVADRTDEDGDVIAEGIDFGIDYAATVGETEDGITVARTESDAIRAYVQPTPSGVRVLTAIASANAPEDYSYTLDVPEDTQLVDAAVGFHLVHDSDIFGAVYTPWAKDANGKDLPTSYTWNHGVLTQHVDLSASSIAYPVLLDPNWGYSFGYNLNKSPATNWNALHSCFNCEFPVQGAPASFPTYNQLLPLVAYVPWPSNFECRMGSVFTGTNYYGWQFNATANHIDGYGSNIIFQLEYVGSQSKLLVDAYVVNDFWAGNLAYSVGAANNWQNFANNLNS